MFRRRSARNPESLRPPDDAGSSARAVGFRSPPHPDCEPTACGLMLLILMRLADFACDRSAMSRSGDECASGSSPPAAVRWPASRAVLDGTEALRRSRNRLVWTRCPAQSASARRRLTITLRVKGLSGATIQRASASRRSASGVSRLPKTGLWSPNPRAPGETSSSGDSGSPRARICTAGGCDAMTP